MKSENIYEAHYRLLCSGICSDIASSPDQVGRCNFIFSFTLFCQISFHLLHFTIPSLF